MQKELDGEELSGETDGDAPEATGKEVLEPVQETADAPANDAAETIEAAEAALAGEDVEALRQALTDAEAKIAEQWDQLVRARAEQDNLVKRHERELESAHKYALEKFVGELLGVWDSLELGLSHVQDNVGDIDKLREGTELTLKLLTDAMGKFGVEQVDPEGQAFNPELHQAMSLQPREDVAPNTVVNVIQKGCTLNGRLVRPALVIVSQAGGAGPNPGTRLDTEA